MTTDNPSQPEPVSDLSAVGSGVDVAGIRGRLEVATRSCCVCARCKVNVREHQYTGCLCSDCEEAIDGMTQAELDADFAAFGGPSSAVDPEVTG